MDTFQKEYIGLMQAAFTGQSHIISSDFDWEKAVFIAQRHNIAPVLFYGAINCNVPKDTEHMQELHRLTLLSCMISTRQSYEIEQVEEAFKKENIDYMPLKGTILKTLYPKPEMRAMGDADILIKLSQYSEIEKIVQGLGFSFQKESDHELVWYKPSLLLELHKSVMTSYNKDFYQYFGDGWRLANKTSDGCRYEMSKEDFYIYIFVHFTKHYRITGIGIKHLLDLWVYMQAYSELNWEYITQELEKMHLTTFHQNVLKTIGVWFGTEEETEITDLITAVIFNSGQYGSKEMAIVNRALQNGKERAWIIKLEKLWQSIFLPYHVMQKKYAVLKRAPFLLPIMWMVRCMHGLFRQQDDVTQYMRRITQVKQEQLKENQRALSVVGLEFHNE